MDKLNTEHFWILHPSASTFLKIVRISLPGFLLTQQSTLGKHILINYRTRYSHVVLVTQYLVSFTSKRCSADKTPFQSWKDVPADAYNGTVSFKWTDKISTFFRYSIHPFTTILNFFQIFFPPSLFKGNKTLGKTYLINLPYKMLNRCSSDAIRCFSTLKTCSIDGTAASAGFSARRER